MFMTFKSNGIFDQIFHTYACLHFLNIGMRNSFFMEHPSGQSGSVNVNAHGNAIELHGIFGTILQICLSFTFYSVFFFINFLHSNIKYIFINTY